MRNVALSNFHDVFSRSVLVEYKPGSPNKTGFHANPEHNKKVTAAVRLIVPVVFKGNPYALVVTAECFGDTITLPNTPATLYEVYARKKNDTRPEATLPASSAVYSSSILDWLSNVKDLNGNPYVVDGQLNTKLRETVYNQPAWYGSPYTFDKFDLGKIGSGEGAQAHGWGLYFAADKKVSEAYKEELAIRSKTIITLNGDKYVFVAGSFTDSAGELLEWRTPKTLALDYIMRKKL